MSQTCSSRTFHLSAYGFEIPAKEKIKEIGRGTRNDFTDKVVELAEIRRIVNNLLMSARYEVLLLFSTANSFYRAKNSGMLNLLPQVPNDVTVKVLIPSRRRR